MVVISPASKTMVAALEAISSKRKQRHAIKITLLVKCTLVNLMLTTSTSYNKIIYC